MTAALLHVLLGTAYLLPSTTHTIRVAQQRAPPPRAVLFEQRQLEVGEMSEGIIAKITDYGFFVRMGHQQHMGLVHIKQLVNERLERETIPDYIQEEVGPEGSKVLVEVQSLEYRGRKQTSLRLLDVISRQRMEDLVFAPGPRRVDGGFDDDVEEEDA